MGNHDTGRSDNLEVIKKIKEEDQPGIPFFELYSFVIMLGLVPIFFLTGIMEKQYEVYQVMDSIARQKVWGIISLAACITLFVGLITNQKRVRLCGLVIAGVIWFFIASSHLYTWPNMPSYIALVNSIFCFISISEIDKTNILSEERREKRNNGKSKILKD